MIQADQEDGVVCAVPREVDDEPTPKLVECADPWATSKSPN